MASNGLKWFMPENFGTLCKTRKLLREQLKYIYNIHYNVNTFKEFEDKDEKSFNFDQINLIGDVGVNDFKNMGINPFIKSFYKLEELKEQFKIDKINFYQNQLNLEMYPQLTQLINVVDEEKDFNEVLKSIRNLTIHENENKFSKLTKDKQDSLFQDLEQNLWDIFYKLKNDKTSDREEMEEESQEQNNNLVEDDDDVEYIEMEIGQTVGANGEEKEEEQVEEDEDSEDEDSEDEEEDTENEAEREDVEKKTIVYYDIGDSDDSDDSDSNDDEELEKDADFRMIIKREINNLTLN
ncbi:DgyrCDS14493 [Dimorphilus gyrociliatus]|uniref:DgyrCDS14493 n=1 Tax=Dimorphilus gyrociliatus TaxID=2664684 RepID=A0A7I8WDT5_9ANNE|nr:DgyrCDS14493 [Dimorphilus gyrociliatus]